MSEPEKAVAEPALADGAWERVASGLAALCGEAACDILGQDDVAGVVD